MNVPGAALMTQTPVSLLERLRRPDDPAAWTRFVELYTPLLDAWARCTGLPPEDTAELVQDVFVVLVRRLPEFVYEPGKSFRAWLRTVTVNKWREMLRRRQGQPVTADGADLDALPAPPEAEAFWEAEYRRYLIGRVLAVIQRDFEPAVWKACWECVANGRPAPEVAVELGMTPGAVRVAKCRVLGRLRKELAGIIE